MLRKPTGLNSFISVSSKLKVETRWEIWKASHVLANLRWNLQESICTFRIRNKKIDMSEFYFGDKYRETEECVLENYWIRKMKQISLFAGLPMCLSRALIMNTMRVVHVKMSRPFLPCFLTMPMWNHLIGQRFNIIRAVLLVRRKKIARVKS